MSGTGSVKIFRLFSKIVLVMLSIITLSVSAMTTEAKACSDNLIGLTGNLVKQGVALIRQRGGVITIPPAAENPQTDDAATVRHTRFSVVLEREGLTSLVYTLELPEKKVTAPAAGGPLWRQTPNAELSFAILRHKEVAKVTFVRARISYEEKFGVETRTDTYRGSVKYFDLVAPMTVTISYARQEDEGPDMSTWKHSGSATLSLDSAL